MFLSLVFLCGLVAALALFYDNILAYIQHLKTLPKILEEKFEEEKRSPIRESTPLRVKIDKKRNYTEPRRKREPLMISLYVYLNKNINILVALKSIPIHVTIMVLR